MIQGAQLSNSFILLMALSGEATNEVYSLERRLKREGYVEGIEMNNKGLYSITPKGQKLLEGWIAFLSAYSK